MHTPHTQEVGLVMSEEGLEFVPIITFVGIFFFSEIQCPTFKNLHFTHKSPLHMLRFPMTLLHQQTRRETQGHDTCYFSAKIEQKALTSCLVWDAVVFTLNVRGDITR